MDLECNPYAERRTAAHALLDAVIGVDETADVETNDRALRIALAPFLDDSLEGSSAALGAVDVITFLAKAFANRTRTDMGSVVTQTRDVLNTVYSAHDPAGHAVPQP